MTSSGQVQPGGPATITAQIFDAGGSSVLGGQMLFLAAPSDSLHFEVSQKGTFKYSSEDFAPRVAYAVTYFDDEGQAQYHLESWQFKTQDYDAQYDGQQRVNRLQVLPVFKVTEKSGPAGLSRMAFNTRKTANPWWYDPLDISLPRYLMALQTTLLFGNNWTTNEEALGGVLKNSPGFQASFAYRFGYPRTPNTGGASISFRELALSYAFNGYELRQVQDPDATADVFFHRATVAFNFGRLSNNFKNHQTFGPALSLGGIYDGSSRLQYQGRDYGLFGFGLQGKLIVEILETDGPNLGLQGQGELMYYPADRGDNDFWFGFAPSLSLGIVVY